MQEPQIENETWFQRDPGMASVDQSFSFSGGQAKGRTEARGTGLGTGGLAGGGQAFSK